MLAGAYPSDEFAELKPRVIWDRVTDVVEGRRDARVVAVTSGGTIPDRGLYGVFLVGEPGTPGRRVGELDEEMVYESRVGEVITLGASAWRIEEISHDRVVVSPGARRARQAAVLARRRGRPADRARPGARRVRRRARGRPRPRRRAAARPPWPGSASATTSIRSRPRTCSPTSRTSATSAGALPTDRRIVVERFRDELGDWRLVPADAVRRPGPRAVGARARDAPERAPRGRGPDDLVGRRDRGPAARRREPRWRSRRCSSRTPRRSRSSSSGRSPTRPCSRRGSARTRRAPCSCRAAGPGRGRRSGSSASGRPTCSPSPAATAASRSSSRRTASACPTCSTCRRCARSSAGVARREIAVHRVETVRASPFASSLLFDYVAAYMYEGDAPLAERRAQALTLDRDLLRELLGPGGAPRAARPGRAGRPRAGAPGPGRRAAGDDRRPAPRPAPPASATSAEAEVAARCDGPGRRERGLARRARGRPARGGRPDRRRAALDRDRGCRPLPRRRRRPAAGRCPARVPRADGRRARGSPRPLRPDPRPVPLARARAPLGPPGRGRRGRPRAAAGRRVAPARRVPAGWRRARVVRPRGAPPAPPPLARPPPARGRAGRAGRARRGSCPTGRGWRRSRGSAAARPRRLRPTAARRRSSGSPRSSTSWPGCRSRPRSSSVTSCRRGSRATSHASSTSSARSARSPGWGGEASAATTAGSRCSVPGARRCARRAAARDRSRRPPRNVRPARATRRSGRSSPGAAPRSIARSTPPPGAAPIARCSTRCGTSSGPARSRTTRSPRSVPSAGRGRVARPGGGPAG